MDTPATHRRVLIVEDDPQIKGLIETILHQRAFETDCVTDGAAALRQLQARQYGAVLLDLMLPRLNGFEVIRKLKRRRAELLDRIIVVTAASRQTLQLLEPSDVRTVVQKPFDIDDLVRAVDDCVQSHAANGMVPQ